MEKLGLASNALANGRGGIGLWGQFESLRRMAERLENRTYEKEKEPADAEKNVRNSDTVQPGNVAYIPDENDPSLLRKVKIIRDTD